MRSIGNHDLMLGLVGCAVQMMTAIDDHDRKGSRFHHHPADNSYGAVKMPKICEGCGEVVSQSDTVTGYEDNGKTVMLTNDELATIAANTGTALNISRFIRAKQVNPMYFSGEKAYYLVPDKKRGSQAEGTYMTIVKVLSEQDLVGVVQYTKWGRNRIALLRVEHTEINGEPISLLVIQNMMWPDELREPAFPQLTKLSEASIDPRLLPVGRQVIESMTEDWNPADYRDTYMDALNAAIEAKAAGAEIEVVEAADAATPDDIEDLLAKLQQSVAAKKAPAKKAAAKKAPAKRAPARKSA